ncbi:MAG: FIST signal transduction protein [Micavibrio sp.]
MTCARSKQFISTLATGADWRDVTRKLLESLEGAAGDAESKYNLGFLYITDLLVEDAESMLDLIRAVTGIDHWVGAVGVGVCGSGLHHIDRPAAALMLGQFPADGFKVFPSSDLSMGGAREALDSWLDSHEAMLVLAHGDPVADSDPGQVLAELERITGGFVAGGLSASRKKHILIADQVATGGIGGVAFCNDVHVATTLTQGCAPLGQMHTITRADNNVVMELDGRPTFEVFADDLKTMALSRAGEDPAKVKIAEAVFRSEAGDMGEGIKSLFRGDVHVAFPVAGSDQRDYLVRNILGLDPDSGWMAVPQQVEAGQHVMFVHRSDETIETDLIRALSELRARLTRERGQFAPLGALYISCVARAGGAEREMQLIREGLGAIPLAGFYANGEISNRRLYGYTGVLILFL